MPLLELKSISKGFGGTPALREVSFGIGAGERIGLIGENGAGKSTLIKILSGVHRPDAGEMIWDGRRVSFGHPLEAMAAGISTIHQELAYFEKLTVAENLLMGEKWPRRSWGGTDWGALNAEARRRLEVCELKLEPETVFHRLSAAQRQEVAIARALAMEARLLILDEPSASLTAPEVARLFAHLERLRARGVALLYVSHRLDEICRLTDRVVVLRDGALVGEYPTAEARVERMVRDMVGRELQIAAERVPGEGVDRARGGGAVGSSNSAALLKVEHLTLEPLFRDISFSIQAGEILGLGGLIGAGRSEVARAIFGLYAGVSGRMELHGERYAPADAAEARRRGVVYVPEERKRQGFVLEHSLRNGISIGSLEQMALFGIVARREEERRVRAAVARFGIHARSIEQPVGRLSGGNQQKALLARWLEGEPKLVILDEPTRGVDVGAKAQIHGVIRELGAKGKAVLLISSDLPELLRLSDRILILREGQIAAKFAGETTQEEVLLAASGLSGEEFPKDLHAKATTLS